ncbi:oxygen-independent coproporphyrinogen III oxidase [Tribonema minus]|uniref:Radical S-adenosyl methionine domain-containing protein 1, mitochondrial n=1 Tax=Tribonema minus TaxID=303371 RepID=A0A836CMJ4_9STRA|nr:oxygen-independent coproporphyrinogen III oxidase [Tribonema minus]
MINFRHDRRATAAPRSVYIHIPFCRRRCYYCDFPIKVVGDRPGDADRAAVSYVALLKREIRATKRALGESIVPAGGLQTVFFGGGTPSLCPPELMSELIELVKQEFGGLAPGAEICAEMDPGTFDAERLRRFLDIGLTRISMGVQSFDESLLRACGRAHSVDDALRAVSLLHAERFANFGIDLICGLPNQTRAQWRHTLSAAVDTRAAHISVYDLQVEDGTAFGRWFSGAGAAPFPEESEGAGMFRDASAVLGGAFYDHYEISNYARPGHQSAHNRAYWENRHYLAFGNGAASHVARARFSRPRRLQEYEAWVEQLESSNDWASATGGEPMDSESAAIEGLMLGLRLSEGVDLDKLREEVGAEWVERVLRGAREGVEGGLARVEGGRLALTNPEGMLMSNSVISGIFAELGETGE